MGLCGKLFLLIFGAAAVFIGVKINKCLEVPPLPQLDDKEIWGANTAKYTDIKPFKISIDDKVLKDLKYRLDNARPFTPPLEGIQQQYGMNTKLLSEIVTHWKTKYDWRSREVFLNQFPQFTTIIQGLSIHYIHVKPTNVPKNVKVVPILLLHGWPGSVREFYGLIPLLTAVRPGKDFVFEVIAPSLPGYGFSDGAVKPGLGIAQVAVVFKNLMQRLGFDKYYLQGGDWGAMITSYMATLFPERVLGVHSNMCAVDTGLSRMKLFLGSIYPGFVVDKKFEHKMYPLSTAFTFLLKESGYMHIQATKPDTVGVGLNDSPVGLAAYILEKFTSWTEPEWINLQDGGLKKKFTYTDILDNVMIYWVTNSITTSVRLYSESLSFAQKALNLDAQKVTVPSACARFKNELMYQPDSILKEKYVNLVQSTDFNDGGHFAAFEVPEKLASDVWSAVEIMRTPTPTPKKN